MLRKTFSWNRLLRVVSWMIRWIVIVRKRVKNQYTTTSFKALAVTELKKVESIIMKTYQYQEFKELRILIGQENRL